MTDSRAYIWVSSAWRPFSAYGAVVIDELSSLLCAPSLKGVHANDWPEHDGLDVDLSDVTPNAMGVNIDVAFTETQALHDLFINDLKADTYVFLKFAPLGGMVKRLRFVGEANVDYEGTPTSRLSFQNDDPLALWNDDTTRKDPPAEGIWIDARDGWSMAHPDRDAGDGRLIDVSLSAYGIHPRNGVFDSLYETGGTKGVFTHSDSGKSGVRAYGVHARASRSVELELYAYYPTLAQFNAVWPTFLYDLMCAGRHVMETPLGEFWFYHEKLNVSDVVYTDEGIRFTFRLTTKTI